MNLDDIRYILSLVECAGMTFVVRQVPGWSPYLQVEFEAQDAVGGSLKGWKGRKWMLSEHMTRSEIVQTALMAALAATEHECRERFRYRGAAIFCPHFDVDKLVAFGEAGGLDVR